MHRGGKRQKQVDGAAAGRTRCGWVGANEVCSCIRLVTPLPTTHSAPPIVPGVQSFTQIPATPPATDLPLVFHVYAPNPNSTFSKKAPPQPDFSLCVAPEVPSLPQLQAMAARLHPGDPPIKVAYTNQGDVGFMELVLQR